MHATHKFGLFFIILLCTSYCISTNDTRSNETDDKKYFDEEDYEEEYYDDDENDGVIRELPNNIDGNKIETTTIKTTETSIDTGDIFIQFPQDVDLKCPENCECSDENQFINCSSRNLQQVPKNIPETVVRLDLSHNSINHLNEDDFINCTNLMEIFLNGNNISSINREVFSNLKRLDHIDLRSNALTEIEPNTFADAVNLSKLNLTDNSILIPMDTSFLNQPHLKELYLINCSIPEIYDETFSNLTSLTSVALSHNDLSKKINTKAFESLTKLRKLRLPDIEQDNIKELCVILPSIDIISLKDFDISCFELVSGTSFEDSIVTADRDLVPPSELEESVSDSNRSQKNAIEQKIKKGVTTMNSNISLTTTISDINLNETSPTSSDDDKSTYQVAVSSQTINHILIGIIILAVIGLAIGLVCRKDLCGIKTKFCRSRRPPPTDQVRPAEEIPLNKV